MRGAGRLTFSGQGSSPRLSAGCAAETARTAASWSAAEMIAVASSAAEDTVAGEVVVAGTAGPVGPAAATKGLATAPIGSRMGGQNYCSRAADPSSGHGYKQEGESAQSRIVYFSARLLKQTRFS